MGGSGVGSGDEPDSTGGAAAGETGGTTSGTGGLEATGGQTTSTGGASTGGAQNMGGAPQCEDGFELNGSWQCVDVNECQEPDNGCSEFSICRNYTGGFRCTDCLPGFETSELGACDAIEWVHQFGSTGHDYTNDLVYLDDGGVIVVGENASQIGSEAHYGGEDGYIRRLDAAGDIVWHRSVGSSSGDDKVTAVALAPSGQVIVAGTVTGSLEGETDLGETDGFIQEYDIDGTLQWTKQIGSSGADDLVAMAVDGDGNIVVTGYTTGLVTGTQQRDGDIFVQSFSSAGLENWASQFGSREFDYPQDLSINSSGTIAVSGYVSDDISGETHVGLRDLFVRTYSNAGVVGFTAQWGSTGYDGASGVAIADDGRVLAAGYTAAQFETYPQAGGEDFIVREFASDGTVNWTDVWGGTGADRPFDAAPTGAEGWLLAGYTQGDLAGTTDFGETDAIAFRYDSAGSRDWTYRLGDEYGDRFSVLAPHSGGVVLAGATYGSFGGEPYVQNLDAIVLNYVDLPE